jgi:mRNA-degrading endonuclease RelE of RelBE toxin-antitoxin system
MVRVTFSPEGYRSLSKLPKLVRLRFNESFTIFERSGPEVNLLDTHRPSGTRDLWTLRISDSRGIYRWMLDEPRFIRFGHRARVYLRLPK